MAALLSQMGFIVLVSQLRVKPGEREGHQLTLFLLCVRFSMHLFTYVFLAQVPDHTEGSASRARSCPSPIYYESFFHTKERPHRARQLLHRVKDIRDTFEWTKSLNAGNLPDHPELSKFANSLDLSSGYVAAGHSFGGGTSIACGITDDQCTGVIALDPWVVCVLDNDLFERPSSTPILSITADQGASKGGYWRKNCSHVTRYVNENEGKMVLMEGANHFDVCDLSLYLRDNLYFPAHDSLIRSFLNDLDWLATSTPPPTPPPAFLRHHPPF
jgi:hypothetical protein